MKCTITVITVCLQRAHHQKHDPIEKYAISSNEPKTNYNPISEQCKKNHHGKKKLNSDGFLMNVYGLIFEFFILVVLFLVK